MVGQDGWLAVAIERTDVIGSPSSERASPVSAIGGAQAGLQTDLQTDLQTKDSRDGGRGRPLRRGPPSSRDSVKPVVEKSMGEEAVLEETDRPPHRLDDLA